MQINFPQENQQRTFHRIGETGETVKTIVNQGSRVDASFETSFFAYDLTVWDQR
jgi:hypothetical protein